MQEADLFLVFLDAFEANAFTYMVTGSVAGILYGEPRMTHDIDIVLRLETETISDLLRAFGSEAFYCPPEEVIRSEAARETRGHFNIIHIPTGFKADIYPVGRDELHQWAMERRRRFTLGGVEVQVAPPEYVIVRKLQYYREGGSGKHLRDIRKMLDISADKIDTDQLEAWINTYHLSEVWGEVLRGE